MLRTVAFVLAVAVLTGCVQRMDRQPHLRAFDPSKVFADGAAMRPLVPGTVARDDHGPVKPPPVTPALLETGRVRYNIYCAPCHGVAGDGDGVVVQHGFPAPPTYHQDRLRRAPEGHFYDVITHGYGVMYPYASRVTPAERWAIIAYIRALQLARHATIADVPAVERARLEGGAP